MGWLNSMRRRFLCPVDWTRGAGRAAAPPPESVAVVIPIYGAADELAACLRSVAAESDLTRHRVVLVVDGPQDDAVESLVNAFAASRPETVTVVRNDLRHGFVHSVNRGIDATSGDVILLNSDTIVTAQWMEKLIEAAYSDGDIGTVTALSNNATICSVPRGFAHNLLPAGFDLRSFAALVERVSTRSRPRIPTGVGFCLYVRRALLDDIGAFDERSFPVGYGEENDFCMRALARGWLHVADDATFVWHAGHRSFGLSRKREQRRASAALARLHPRFEATIAEAMRHDPLADVRARIEVALAPQRNAGDAPLRIVHVVHGWPPYQHAGTELYAAWLVARQRETHDVAVYTRGGDPSLADGEAVEQVDYGVRVRIVTNHFTSRDPFRRNALRHRALERDFERFLREERPDLVHIHHLAGHTFSLAAVARRMRVPIVMQVQDWWALCARVNLLDRDGNRCSGPAPAKCAACATLTRVPPARVTNRAMHAVRRAAARRALRAADAFIAGSNAIRADYAAIAPRSTPFHVLPYGVAIAGTSEQRAPVRQPVRFGYVGSIAPHKGVHVAAEAMRGVDASLHIWGDATALPAYVASMAAPNVVFCGRFAEDEKERVFASMDVLLVPSIGLESFGLAAREAMARGVPVVASAGGALSEMFEGGACGELFPAGDAGALHAILARLAADPALIDRFAEHLPRPKSDAVHAAEVEEVYRSVLAR